MTIGSPIKLLSKVVVIVAMLALFFLVGVSSPTAHAQASHRAMPASDVSKCARVHTSSFDIFCDGPSMTSFCGSGQWFGPFNDTHGQSFFWTKTDRSNTCVKVSYTLQHSFGSCDVEMYIPNADSSATFTYNWFDGVWHSGTFNENPVDGWQFLFTSSSATQMYFTDHADPNNPNEPGNQALGWGSSNLDGLRVTCG